MNEARAIFAMGVASARARNEVPRLRVRSSRAGGGRKGHWSARFQDVTEAVIAGLSAAYRENAPEFIYFLTLYNIFHEFLEDVSEDELPNEATGFRESQVWQMLYSFQRDAMLAIVGKLEKFNGCILADSVGLGKTLTALAVVKYYESRNKTVLVLCPKKLAANWNTYKGNYVNNPRAKGRDVLMPGRTDEIDILIATDCISEGQNLQDCDYVVNYDIHWNPVRIIQRFGRVDRIGSPNDAIQLVNFWPDVDLDEYINLKERVESRMKLSVMTSTGDENPIDAEEKGDLEYRRAQLKRLQTEVVDIEDMASGVSIQDLGLNEFRLDLLAYLKRHGGDIEYAPKGLHAVVAARPDVPPGVIFILRNVNDSVNAGDRNRIHPFYMVYVDEAGVVVRNHLDPKKLLDTVRLLCRGKTDPCVELCRRFNAETDDGRRMEAVSALLGKAVESIVAVKAESDIDSLFSAGGTSALLSEVSGLDDFELICFLVVKEGA